MNEKRAEEARIKVQLDNILRQLNSISKSNLWSYTREFELGILDAAITLLERVYGDLHPTSGVLD